MLIMWVHILLGMIACEALTQLWFHAAPLQPLRGFLVRATPFLYSGSQQTHLLDCRYCTSVWVGLLLAILYFLTIQGFLYFTFFLAVHRGANWIHLVFSYLRDRQIDLRIARK